jgi:diketogulonate reductase-like aldo/keto reductase
MSLTINSTVTLAGGVDIPRLGLGVYQTPSGRPARDAVRHALECGYRHIDTAALYGNEADVGAAVRDSALPREEVFVTTKLWNDDHGYNAALSAFEESRRRLGLEFVDLYLVHWPVAGLRVESWRALETLQRDGRCRAVGVSNYTVEHIEEVLETGEVGPAVNQVEFSPFLYQRELLKHCHARGIRLEAYSPLTKARRLDDETIAAVGERCGKTPAQVMIRWALQHDVIVIPKSANAGRIRENADVFDFELSEEDMAVLDGLDEGLRTSWDPTGAP